jgi:hypothetical protein
VEIKSLMRILVQRNLGERRWNHFVQAYDFKEFSKNNNELNELLKENIKYKNIHKDKRCFVLGNGPSLKEQDLSLLENEIVFTCNQIARNPNFEKIKTNYHFWADPIFFNLDENKPEDKELLCTMKNVNTKDNQPQCFFSSDAFNFVKKYNLCNELKISFYKPALTFCENFDLDIDFSRFVPSFHTVVQYAVIMAIYMGFKDIYILGSEFTGVLTSINLRLQNNLKDDYAYDISENEKLRMKSRVNKITFEQEMSSFLHVVRDYRRLYSFCSVRNVNLINCTPGGLIESLPRKKYEEIIIQRSYSDV